MNLINRVKLNISVMFFSLLLIVSSTSHATIYFYFDAENGTDGTNLSNPPFCQTECTSAYAKGTYQSSGGAPQGSKYFQWQTVNNQPEAYTVIGNVSQNPPLVSNALGNTYYVAYYFNFTRINGLDIWHETGQSADKGVEIVGSGIRWVLGRGNWATLINNQDHRYTVFVGNPSYHLNLSFEHGDIYWPNQNGYNSTNTLQLQYERWYSAVMAVKIASDNTGYVTFWIDGVKIGEYNNIRTAANSSPTISHMVMGGTIAQGAYDAPAHYRKFDALLLTDNWQDIINGGYLGKRPTPGSLNPPQPQ
jgi:hypothetical protein